MISPKTSIKRVRIPVAISMAVLPKRSIARVVVREEAAILTILLPMRIVLRNFALLSISDSRSTAHFEPSSAKVFILILLTDVNAVSADEKKADSIRRKPKIIKRATAPGSKMITLLVK